MNIASNPKTVAEQHPKKPPGIIRRLPTSTVGMVGLGLILFWVVMALIVPFLPIPTYSAMDVDAIHNPYPEWGGHLLGTDRQGRDILARLLWGGQTVLLVAPFATLCAYAIGVPIGLAAGYYGGKVDMILSRLADIILSFPILVLYVLLVTILGASILNIVIAVVLASCPAISRIVRGLTLEQRTHDYVAAASLRRENAFYIMFIEILPNCRGPLITDFLPARRLYDYHHWGVGLFGSGAAAAHARLGRYGQRCDDLDQHLSPHGLDPIFCHNQLGVGI